MTYLHANNSMNIISSAAKNVQHSLKEKLPVNGYEEKDMNYSFCSSQLKQLDNDIWE